MTPLARDARSDDYATFALFFEELRKGQPPPGASFYDARIRPHAFFLVDGEAPVAYAFWDAAGDDARIIHVVVDPKARGRGLGDALMTEIAARARRVGCTTWYLNVRTDNGPAMRLYARWGMSEKDRVIVMEMAWSDVEKLPAEDARLTAFVAGPQDDAELEAAFQLPTGDLAGLRKGSARVLVGLRREGAVTAFVSMDPAFPLVSPCLGVQASNLRCILEALKPHAREVPWVRFDAVAPGVQERVEQAGGKVARVLATWEGRIPTTPRLGRD